MELTKAQFLRAEQHARENGIAFDGTNEDRAKWFKLSRNGETFPMNRPLRSKVWEQACVNTQIRGGRMNQAEYMLAQMGL